MNTALSQGRYLTTAEVATVDRLICQNFPCSSWISAGQMVKLLRLTNGMRTPVCVLVPALPSCSAHEQKRLELQQFEATINRLLDSMRTPLVFFVNRSAFPVSDTHGVHVKREALGWRFFGSENLPAIKLELGAL